MPLEKAGTWYIPTNTGFRELKFFANTYLGEKNTLFYKHWFEESMRSQSARNLSGKSFHCPCVC